jgi:hypothetical protein
MSTLAWRGKANTHIRPQSIAVVGHHRRQDNQSIWVNCRRCTARRRPQRAEPCRWLSAGAADSNRAIIIHNNCWPARFHAMTLELAVVVVVVGGAANCDREILAKLISFVPQACRPLLAHYSLFAVVAENGSLSHRLHCAPMPMAAAVPQ